MQSDEDSLCSIPEEIFTGCEFNPHHHIFKHDQLNGYHHISTTAHDSSSVTDNDNIPAIITNIVNDAWIWYKQHRKEYNTDFHNTTAARMVICTRKAIIIFPPPDAEFAEPMDMNGLTAV